MHAWLFVKKGKTDKKAPGQHEDVGARYERLSSTGISAATETKPAHSQVFCHSWPLRHSWQPRPVESGLGHGRDQEILVTNNTISAGQQQQSFSEWWQLRNASHCLWCDGKSGEWDWAELETLSRLVGKVPATTGKSEADLSVSTSASQ